MITFLDTELLLLNCISKYPEEDISYLMLADHYEEEGGYEEAEFIRVAIQLDRYERDATFTMKTSGNSYNHCTCNLITPCAFCLTINRYAYLRSRIKDNLKRLLSRTLRIT